VNSTTEDDITAYVGAVQAAMAGMPDPTRDELLEDLPEHLAEVKADGAGSLVDRLGTPEAYAAELRATAGFIGGFPDPPGRYERLTELHAAALSRLRTVDTRVGPLLGYARASEFLAVLRPAWWLLRGYLAAMVVAWALDDSGQPMGLLPRIGGSEVVAAMMLAGGILGSLWLGRRSAAGLSRWPRVALYAGSVVLVLVAIGGFVNADSTALDSRYSDVNYNNPYSNVQDVFVYDGQGHLVSNARLFDQDGQPIQLGNPYCYDLRDGSEIGRVDDSKYPYCPDRAPFQMPSAPAASMWVDPGSPTPSGPVPSGPVPSGPVPSGSVPSGPVPSGAAPSGAAPSSAGTGRPG
jgi:hypothetical protein